MIQLSAYGITLSFTVQDIKELGLLTEENLSRVVKFVQKEAKEAGVKLSDLINGGDIKSFVENAVQKSADDMIEYVRGTIENEKLFGGKKK